MKGAQGSKAGIFGGDDKVLEQITDRKKVEAAVQGTIVAPPKKKAKKLKTKAAAKDSAKSDSTKKSAADGGSKTAKAKKVKDVKAKATKGKKMAALGAMKGCREQHSGLERVVM